MVKGKRLHYAWVVTSLVFVTLLAAAGIRAAPGVLMVPLEGAFGWDRIVVILTASTATGQLIFLPVIAMVVDRWGWRAASAMSLMIGGRPDGEGATVSVPGLEGGLP